MTNKLLIIVVFMVFLVLSPGGFALSFAKTYPYTIDISEHLILEAASCKKHNSKIVFFNAYKYEMKSKEITAYVECIGSSNNEGNSPFYMEHCSGAGEGYQIEINNRKFNIILHGVPLDLAATTLSKISRSSFQSRSIDELIGTGCSVSYAGSKEELEYDCGWKSRITVSLFCPTSNCPRILWVN
jgi:hypothetical protein